MFVLEHIMTSVSYATICSYTCAS